MDTSQILAIFADPSQIKTLSLYQLLVGGLVTTLLGMGVTFVVLIILQYVIMLLAKFAMTEEEPPAAARKSTPTKARTPTVPSSAPDAELVAAIAASLAMMLGTPASNLRIRSIRRFEEPSPEWSRVGRLEQMQNRF